MKLARLAMVMLGPALFLYATSVSGQSPASRSIAAVNSQRDSPSHDRDLLEAGMAGLRKALANIAPGTSVQTHLWMIEDASYPLGDPERKAVLEAFPRASFVLSSDSAVDCPPGEHLSYPLHPCPIRDNGVMAFLHRPHIEGDSAWVDVGVNHAGLGMTFARVKGIWTFVRIYLARAA